MKNKENYQKDEELFDNLSSNDFAKDMNVMRDVNAMEKIKEAKLKYKNIIMSAGSSHVEIWKNDIGKMYE